MRLIKVKFLDLHRYHNSTYSSWSLRSCIETSQSRRHEPTHQSTDCTTSRWSRIPIARAPTSIRPEHSLKEQLHDRNPSLNPAINAWNELRRLLSHSFQPQEAHYENAKPSFTRAPLQSRKTAITNFVATSLSRRQTPRQSPTHSSGPSWNNPPRWDGASAQKDHSSLPEHIGNISQTQDQSFHQRVAELNARLETTKMALQTEWAQYQMLIQSRDEHRRSESIKCKELREKVLLPLWGVLIITSWCYSFLALF